MGRWCALRAPAPCGLWSRLLWLQQHLHACAQLVVCMPRICTTSSTKARSAHLFRNGAGLLVRVRMVPAVPVHTVHRCRSAWVLTFRTRRCNQQADVGCTHCSSDPRMPCCMRDGLQLQLEICPGSRCMAVSSVVDGCARNGNQGAPAGVAIDFGVGCKPPPLAAAVAAHPQVLQRCSVQERHAAPRAEVWICPIGEVPPVTACRSAKPTRCLPDRATRYNCVRL